MAAAKYDFTTDSCDGSPLEAGATFSFQLIWEKEDQLNQGTYLPVDLTGYEAKMQVRKAPGSPVILELSTANTRITLGGTQGLINLVVPANATLTLPVGKYKYDLDLTDANGFVTRFVQGNFEIVATITV
jgi:hypothetical protein